MPSRTQNAATSANFRSLPPIVTVTMSVLALSESDCTGAGPPPVIVTWGVSLMFAVTAPLQVRSFRVSPSAAAT